MELSTKAISAIKEVKNDYSRLNRLADIEFLITIFDIMDKEEGFSDVLSYEIIEYGKYVAMESQGRVFIDLNRALNETNNLYSVNHSDITTSSEVDARNMFMLVIMFHEFVHIAQEFSFLKNDTLNDLFYNFDSVLDTKKYKIFRMFFGENLFLERHATLLAYRLLVDVINEEDLNEVLATNYLDMIIKNLKKRYMDKAIKHFDFNYGYLDTLPLILKLETCVTLNMEEYELVRKIINTWFKNPYPFEALIKELKFRH